MGSKDTWDMMRRELPSCKTCKHKGEIGQCVVSGAVKCFYNGRTYQPEGDAFLEYKTVNMYEYNDS